MQDPKSLQRALWWFLSHHFGWRARDESRKLGWGDVGLANDPETDSEYLVWKSERGSKTRTGQDGTQAKTSGDAQLSFTKHFKAMVPTPC